RRLGGAGVVGGTRCAGLRGATGLLVVARAPAISHGRAPSSMFGRFLSGTRPSRPVDVTGTDRSRAETTPAPEPALERRLSQRPLARIDSEHAHPRRGASADRPQAHRAARP